MVGANVNREILIKQVGGRRTKVGERAEGAMLLGLKLEEEAMRQGKQAASRSWTRRGNGSSLRGPGRKTALPTP